MWNWKNLELPFHPRTLTESNSSSLVTMTHFWSQSGSIYILRGKYRDEYWVLMTTMNLKVSSQILLDDSGTFGNAYCTSALITKRITVIKYYWGWDPCSSSCPSLNIHLVFFSRCSQCRHEVITFWFHLQFLHLCSSIQGLGSLCNALISKF